MAEESKIIIGVELRQGEAKKRADQLAAAIALQKQERKELLALQKKTIKDLGKESEEARKVAIALNDNSAETKVLNRELRILNREIVAGAGSLNDQRARLAKLNLQYDNFRVGIDGTEKDLESLRKKIQGLDSAIKGNEESTGRFQRSVGNYARAFEGAFGGNIPVIKNFTAVLASPAALITGLVGGIGALGVKLFDMSKQVAAAKLQTEQLTGAQGELNNQVAAAGTAIEKTYGASFEDTLTAANTITRELGGNIATNTEALGNAAALTGAKFDEVLDIVKEYPSQFRNLNISAENFLAIASQQVTEGIYSDKGVDTIKEGLLRLREMPEAARRSLSSIGISGEEIQARIKDGSSTLFEELQNVSSEISKLDPQAEATGKVIANVFGGPGEDAGFRYISTLQDINLNFDELRENASEQIKQQIALQEANTRIENSFNALLDTAGAFFTSSEVGFKQLLADGLETGIRFLESLINGFVDLYNNSLIVRAGFNLVFANLKTGLDIGIAAFKQLLNIGATVGKVIKAALTLDFEDIPNIIRNGLTQSGEITRTAATDIGNNYVDGFESAVNGRLEKVSITPDPSRAEAQASAAGTKAGEAFARSFGAATGRQVAEVEAVVKESQTVLVEFLSTQTENLDQQTKDLLDRQRNNLAEFNLSVQEEIQEANEKTEEQRKQFAEAEAQRKEQEQSAYISIAQAARSSAEAVIEAKGRESKAGQNAAKVLKAAALAEVGLNLRGEISAIYKAASQLSASAPPFTIPLGIAYGVAQGAAALARARSSIAEIRAFNQGGFTYDGQPVQQIRSHKSGGRVNRPTLGLIGEEGPEYVIPNRLLRNPQVSNFVSQLEGMRVKPFVDGGFSSTVINTQALNSDLGNQIQEGFNNMPRQILVVQDVDAAQGQAAEVVNEGTF